MPTHPKVPEMDLQAIEDWASLLLTMEEVCVLVEADEESWRLAMDSKGEAWKAYQRGRLRTITEQRKVLLSLSLSGSAPAQKEVLAIIEQTNQQNT